MKNFIYLVLFIFIACKERDCPLGARCGLVIKVKNNSTKEIMFLTKSTYYKDTTLTNDRDLLVTIPAQSENEKDLKYVNKKSRDNTYVSIYFFDVDTINKYPWSEIVTNFRVQKYQRITYEELYNLGAKITYP